VPRRLAVYCGSNVGADPRFREQAIRLGSAMGRRGIGLVYGGGHVGLMGAVADSVLAAGGEVHGVITRHLVRAEIAHQGLTDLHVVDSMHERKARMAELADGFVAMPGGYGTLDETLEVLTWNQLGLLAKPVVFFDIDGFFAPLFAFLDRATDAALLRPAHRMLAQRARTVDEVIALGLSPAPVTGHKWIDRDPTPTSSPTRGSVEEVG
jgi:uncharacterized protein (TIGR00730 family)